MDRNQGWAELSALPAPGTPRGCGLLLGSPELLFGARQRGTGLGWGLGAPMEGLGRQEAAWDLPGTLKVTAEF